MARQLSIVIDDDASACVQWYVVRYRLVSTDTWYILAPNPIVSPIVIENLLDDSMYEVGVTRYCCNGNVSEEAVETYDTTL